MSHGRPSAHGGAFPTFAFIAACAAALIVFGVLLAYLNGCAGRSEVHGGSTTIDASRESSAPRTVHKFDRTIEYVPTPGGAK